MTESERRVYQIWCDVFHTKDIAIDDNFFEIGGNSLMGMRIVSSLTQRLNKMEVGDFFEYQTIRDIATKIDSDYQWRKS